MSPLNVAPHMRRDVSHEGALRAVGGINIRSLDTGGWAPAAAQWQAGISSAPTDPLCMCATSSEYWSGIIACTRERQRRAGRSDHTGRGSQKEERTGNEAEQMGGGGGVGGLTCRPWRSWRARSASCSRAATASCRASMAATSVSGRQSHRRRSLRPPGLGAETDSSGFHGWRMSLVSSEESSVIHRPCQRCESSTDG